MESWKYTWDAMGRLHVDPISLISIFFFLSWTLLYMKLETYLALCLQPAGVWFGLFANNEVVSEGGTNPLDGNLVTSERYQCHVSAPFVTSQSDYFQ